MQATWAQPAISGDRRVRSQRRLITRSLDGQLKGVSASVAASPQSGGP